MPPYQPGYGGYAGYGGYGQGMPPQPPKRNMAPLIVVVVVLVVAIIAAVSVWALTRNNNPIPPPPQTTSAVIPATTPTGPATNTATTPDGTQPGDTTTTATTPFCDAYNAFTATLVDWGSYQSAVDGSDYSTAAGYMTKFLAAAKAMQAASPPSDLTDSVNIIVDYFTRVQAGLQKGDMSSITSDDDQTYALALLTVTLSGISDCYAG